MLRCTAPKTHLAVTMTNVGHGPEHWVDPYAGFVYQSDQAVVDNVEQQRKLEACGLDPSRLRDQVDPSFYIGLAIRAGINSGISAEGNINMVQSLLQHRPVRLGEALTVRGTINSVESVPRGQVVTTTVWFEDATGGRAISATRKTLRPDPSRTGTRGAGEKPPPIVTDINKLEVVAEYELTPAQVKSYSSEGNAIHYHMETANQAGFRAPMIGGGMGVHYLVAELSDPMLPPKLGLELYFRRPIFWDDRFFVAIDQRRETACLWKLDDDVPKVLTEAAITYKG